MNINVQDASVEAAVRSGTSRAFTIASRAALVATLVWLIEPIAFVATLLNPANMDPDQTLAEFWRIGLPFTYLLGIGEIVFGGAIGLAVYAAEAARPMPEMRRYTVAAARALGLLAGAAMVVAGAIRLTGGGLAGIALTLIPVDDEGTRWLAQQSFMVIHEALRLTACLGLAAWLVVLARTGRRDGMIGRGVAITITIAAALIAIPGAATGLLTGMNLVVVGLIP
ncbi:hypothetical protein [Leucobacter salsicius]|uniref:hypothetical protein n=1 Tax=Leucobacter salsicius TaxID=664638 RepID=UPI0003645518|nr:hypothetical protein [Leucobacter salsicius]